MILNTHKAFTEAIQRCWLGVPTSFFETGCSSLFEERAPVVCRWSVQTDHGFRKENEDCYAVIDGKDALIAGVFDGHGGKEVAKLAAKFFETHFEDICNACEEDPNETLRAAMHQIHHEASQRCELNSQGSTAAVIFLDKKRGELFTSTVGDSEIWVFNRDKIIPLSPIRNWTTANDLKRVEITHGKKLINQWSTGSASSRLIPPDKDHRRLRVSRALGNWDIHSYYRARGKPSPLSHKGKYAFMVVEPGDTVLICTDGVLNLPQIAMKLKKGVAKASNVVDKALEKMKIAINAKTATTKKEIQGDNVL